MASINTYANDLLIEFLGACHVVIREKLSAKYGDSWLQEGVEKHLQQSYFKKIREARDSPMRVVDMDKRDDELYGVEHLWNIFSGNWDVFGAALGEKKRTEVCCKDIAEIRHNISHRRQNNILQREELLSLCQNAKRILRALDSPAFERFDGLTDSILQGGTPWGSSLLSNLPPASEVVRDFVGRREALQGLSEWLARRRASHMVLCGSGGAGKSAIAYQFATQVADSAPEELKAVIWVSAKKTEYLTGKATDRQPDFDSTESFVTAVTHGIYDEPGDFTPEYLLQHLDDTPVLLVVDDLDSVLGNEELESLLLYQLHGSASKILFTSRYQLPGLPWIEVKGFNHQELLDFIRRRAGDYDLPTDACVQYAQTIGNMTQSIPLFVDDLLRHAQLGGIKDALSVWGSNRGGHAAREYALERQLNHLGDPSQRALIAIVVADRPVSLSEITKIAGYTEEDIRHALDSLLKWRLIDRVAPENDGTPTFSCNVNTRRLVQTMFGRDPIFDGSERTYRLLVSKSMPDRMIKAIAQAIYEAKSLVIRGDFAAAEERILQDLTGDLEKHPDMWGALGWVRSRAPDSAHPSAVRDAFNRAHELGSRKEDTYYHWVDFETKQVEAQVGVIPDNQLIALWKNARDVAEKGVLQCGDTKWLCKSLAYLCTREAKTREHLRDYTYARSLFGQGASWARRALVAPTGNQDVPKAQIYRALAVALEGAGDDDALRETQGRWEDAVGAEDS